MHKMVIILTLECMSSSVRASCLRVYMTSDRAIKVLFVTSSCSVGAELDRMLMI
jgi:hypothetical protein